MSADGKIECNNTKISRLVRDMVEGWNQPHLQPVGYEWSENEIHPINFRLADAQVPHDHLRYLFWLFDISVERATEAQQADWDAYDYREARAYVHLFAQANQIVKII